MIDAADYLVCTGAAAAAAFAYPEALIEETERGRTFLIRDEKSSVAPFRMFV